MKSQTSKDLGLKQANFELKRMEVLRYHNDHRTFDTGGTIAVWQLVMLAILFSPMPFIKSEESNKKEK